MIRRDGSRFRLGVPRDGVVIPDRNLKAKFGQISRYWQEVAAHGVSGLPPAKTTCVLILGGQTRDNKNRSAGAGTPPRAAIHLPSWSCVEGPIDRSLVRASVVYEFLSVVVWAKTLVAGASRRWRYRYDGRATGPSYRL